ncbi:MAG: hypothetical protein JSS09_05000, partial [Verrucomicrobia bacterium]|nr:hypothetical protein [Verrucomicrobiota bacterium]
MKTVLVDDMKCTIGTNKEENWILLDNSRPSDLFFHLSSFPSCYVVLSSFGKVSDIIKKQCARLCLEQTKYRNLHDVYVDCTE